MAVVKSDRLSVQNSRDIVTVRNAVRMWSTDLGFNLVDQTKMITAASELARNTVDYGGGGEVTLEMLNDGARRGLRVIFADQGPGINNIELALKDGYTTGSGLGLGLGGSKRLVNDFNIQSEPGKGTRVSITRWK